MPGKVYEIITKATLSKGIKKSISKYEYQVNEIDKVLGCWICNHCFQGVLKDEKTVIEGSFDLHLWYSYLNDSYLLKQKVNYEDIVELNYYDKIKASDEIVVESLSLPRCIFASLDSNIIKIEIEKQMSLKIVGNTTILVESKAEEELKINQDFIK